VSNPERPVFSDPTHRRARAFGVVAVVTVLAGLSVLWIVLSALLNYPTINSGSFRPSVFQTGPVEVSAQRISRLRRELNCEPPEKLVSCAERISQDFLSEVEKLPRDDMRVFAFLPTWPDWRTLSIENHAADIDVLLPQIYVLDITRAELVDFGLTSDNYLNSVAAFERKRKPTAIIPVVQITEDKDPEEVTDATIKRMTSDLAGQAAQFGHDGYCFDVRFSPIALTKFASRLAETLGEDPRWKDKETCLIVPLTFAADVPSDIADGFDNVILAPSGLTTVGLRPGPPMPISYIEEALAVLSERDDRAIFVISINTEALQWRSDSSFPISLSYAHANAMITFNAERTDLISIQGHATANFLDDAGRTNALWFEDVTSAWPVVSSTVAHGVRNFAVWPVGGEDPGIWPLISDTPGLRTQLVTPDLSGYVSHLGDGPFLEYKDEPILGLRTFVWEQKTVSTDIVQAPSPHTILRWGDMPPLTIALTFDDGPDPVYTPLLLDILREEEVPAAFFLIGSKVSANAKTVQQMVDDGHAVGSHSYYHPRLDQCSTTRVCLEAALTQKSLEISVDRSTTVLRLPYARGDGPMSSDEVPPIKDLTQLGYVLVLGNIVPPDWTGLDADLIVDFVMREALRTSGGVLVLHDGGGDRENVVAALPDLIVALRSQGFRFVGLPEMLGADREALMPPVTGEPTWQDQLTFFLLDGLTLVLRVVFWLVIGIGLLRSLAMLIMSQVRRPHEAIRNGAYLTVEVLVPAYNEQTVVAATVSSILESDYPAFRVTAIDDGSSDETLSVLREHFADNPKVKILAKENGGKSTALNHALAQSDADLVVTVDADTLLHPRALRRMARHFTDPKIGAVAGNVKVGNRKNLLTRFQAFEYIVAQNLDRRAAELVNGILVVPGAIGAWRREAIIKAGLYPKNTLAEDADLTVAVHRAGYRVVFEPDAIAITEAPETIHQLLKQRLRWSLSMMQVAWKHRRAVIERRGVGLFSLPDLLIFGVLMPLLAPIVDLVFILAVGGVLASFLYGYVSPYATMINWPILAAYMGLPMLDFLLAALAFHMEPKERKSLIWLLLIQRFFYRQLLYISTIRAFGRALSGRIQAWDKVRRTSALLVGPNER